jgi:hypothetical protein
VPRPAGLNSESDLEGGGSADGSAQPHHSAGQADADRLARQAAQRAGVAASFVCADATTPVTRQTFDLAYARLLLSHLVEPWRLYGPCGPRAVRPGGVVVVEDLFTGTLGSDPPAPALDRLQEVYSATVRFHGGDPTSVPACPHCWPPSGSATWASSWSPTR